MNRIPEFGVGDQIVIDGGTREHVLKRCVRPAEFLNFCNVSKNGREKKKVGKIF